MIGKRYSLKPFTLFEPFHETVWRLGCNTKESGKNIEDCLGLIIRLRYPMSIIRPRYPMYQHATYFTTWILRKMKKSSTTLNDLGTPEEEVEQIYPLRIYNFEQ